MENPAADEVRLLIQLLKTKNVRLVEIHRPIFEVCAEGKMTNDI